MFINIMITTFTIIHVTFIMITRLTVPSLSCMHLLELEDTLSNYIKWQILLISTHIFYLFLLTVTECNTNTTEL